MRLKKFSGGLAVFAATLAVVAASGCSTDKNDQVTLTGELSYSGPARIPADAGARISMIERGPQGGADKRIVAERTLHAIGQKPIKFDITVSRGLIDNEGQYGLRAEIVDAGGEVRWHTPSPVSIEPLAHDRPVKLQLKATPASATFTFSKYRCDDGFHMSAALTQSKAIVRLGNRRLTLATDGDSTTQNFIDEHGNSLLIGDGGRLQFRVDGGDHRNCIEGNEQTPTAVADKAAPDSTDAGDHTDKISGNGAASERNSPEGITAESRDN